MGLLSHGRRIARTARYVVNAGDGDGLLVLAPGPSAARIAQITGVTIGEGTPEGCVVIHALDGPEDPRRVLEALRAHAASGTATVVVLSGTPDERAAQEAALLEAADIFPSRLVHVAALDEDKGRALRRRLVIALPGERAPVAARYPLLRAAASREMVGRSSLYAAALAGVRGAGMPALTVLQVRLLADLAAGHGRPLGSDRAVDVAAVVGAGFAWKLAGRASIGMWSGPVWVARAGIAWAGTRALGAIARNRLDAERDLVPVANPESLRLPSRLSGS